MRLNSPNPSSPTTKPMCSRPDLGRPFQNASRLATHKVLPTMSQREDKPTWSAVPRPVRHEAERLLGSRVLRATRRFGGYGPSATFHLSLADGRTAFFKGVYPLPEGSGVRWALDEEERVYAQLQDHITPWAPEYYGSIRLDGWHAMLIESVSGEKIPPWTESSACRATRSYAEFHAGTIDKPLPDWLSREEHLRFTGFWEAMATDEAKLGRLAALCPTATLRRQAARWVTRHAADLTAAEAPLRKAKRFCLLHFDTRSDNLRLDGDLLRMFDWPWAAVGPPEFDFGAFAQSIASEGGPDPEVLTGWYGEVLPIDDKVLTASVAGIAGYFADRGSQPHVPELPRLRSVQRRQLMASLPWAARRLGLEPPVWLESVAE